MRLPSKKVSSVISILGLVIATIIFSDTLKVVYCSYASSYPSSWQDVKPSMRSSEVRVLVGQPEVDGRDLKKLDRWLVHQNGVDLHMDIYCDGQNHRDSEIIEIHKWKRFMGYNTQKSVAKIKWNPAK